MDAIRNPPINCHYRQCSVDIDDELIPYMIGKDGAHFKRITNMSKTKYIWWNNDKKIIEVWGPEGTLNNAENIIKDHIIYINNFKNLKENLEEKKVQ